jgi:hypothetical protein
MKLLKQNVVDATISMKQLYVANFHNQHYLKEGVHNITGYMDALKTETRERTDTFGGKV